MYDILVYKGPWGLKRPQYVSTRKIFAIFKDGSYNDALVVAPITFCYPTCAIMFVN